jgi:cytochrome c oxidase subunit 3
MIDLRSGARPGTSGLFGTMRGVDVRTATGPAIMARVATATADRHAVHTPGRPSMVSVGTIVWLASELMFFAALFAMYFTVRSVFGPQDWPTPGVTLDLTFAAVNTTVLVLSSVTCQFGVFAAERGQIGRTGSVAQFWKWGLREWFVLTFLMGAFFISGQTYEYMSLVNEGTTISSGPYGSVFFLTTGFHGLHVTGGLFAFLLVLGRTYMARRFTYEQATTAIVVSYYWHFVDVVWIGLFSTIYLIQ